jgi:putative ABC transport system substrate-binding protein
MQRRNFIGGLGGTAVWPLTVRAQQADRKYYLGYLSQSGTTFDLKAELARAGFVDGQNLVFDFKATPLQELAARAAALVAAKADVIFAGGDSAARAAQAATRSIPIVAIADNLVASGLLSSFARPEGNLTGVNIFGSELNGKRQELLNELLPGLNRLALLADPASTSPEQVDILVKAAGARRIECKVHRCAKPADIAAAIGAARAEGAQALNVLSSALFHSRHAEVIELATAARLPAVFQWPEYVEEGALIGYGPRLASIFHNVTAQQIIKALRGIKVADIPAEQPTQFELGVNLKTARLLGLTIPHTLLARADQVVE